MKFTNFDNEWYQQQLMASELISYCYKKYCKRLSPIKIYCLCRMTWFVNSKKVTLRIIKNFWEISNHGKAFPINSLSQISLLKKYKVPPKIIGILTKYHGVVGYYRPYWNSTFSWAKKNYASIVPIIKNAGILKDDTQREKLINLIEKLPLIPKANTTSSKMSAFNLITPLIAYLDPGHRFPLLNKAKHVLKLQKKIGIQNKSYLDKFYTLMGLLRQYNIKDSYQLDVGSSYLASKVEKIISSKGKRISSTMHQLTKKNDKDIAYFVSSNWRKIENRHDKMTNNLRSIIIKEGKSILEGEMANAFDVLIPDYKHSERDLLIEVKGDNARPSLRLAVGQLLDYRRKLSNRLKTDLCVLLPFKPSQDSIDYLHDVGIKVWWFKDNLKKLITK